MNPEGFMIGGVPLFAEVGGFNDFALPRRFERGRTMETTVRELAGTAYAKEFAKKWYHNYLSEEDIRLMAEMGYNSVRLPVSARLFLAEEPEIQWIEEGFATGSGSGTKSFRSLQTCSAPFSRSSCVKVPSRIPLTF